LGQRWGADVGATADTGRKSTALGKASDDPVNYSAEKHDAGEAYEPKDRPGSLCGFLCVYFKFIGHVTSSAKKLF